MNKLWLALVLSAVGIVVDAKAESLRVSALHPLMADLARQIGGDRLEVFDLVANGGNPHHFEPRPDDLAKMQQSALVIAAGMGLEPYLDRLRDTLGADRVIDLGATLPPITLCEADHHDGCGHAHENGSIDPHWWHSISLMRRAAKQLAAELAARDPQNARFYQQQSTAYGKQLDHLASWARVELAKIPRKQRVLVTAHNAFAYFAAEFDFKVIAIAGLNQEQGTAPQDLAATIQAVRNTGIHTMFPEQSVGTKSIEAVARATESRVGMTLVADGNGQGDAAGFEGMIRHNVTAITRALGPP